MSILINILLAIQVIVSFLIIFVTLMQRPKNEGLGAAFGGGMTENLFGAQTSNVLATFTRWLGGTFFALTLLLSVLYAHNSTAPSDIKKELLSKPKPSATPVASASAAPSAESVKEPQATTVTPVLPSTSAAPAPSAAPATPVVVATPAAKSPEATTPAATTPAPESAIPSPASKPEATVAPEASASPAKP